MRYHFTLVRRAIIYKKKISLQRINAGKGVEKGNPLTLLLLLSRVSHVRLCATPQTAAHQAPQSMGLSRQEYQSGVPLPFPHPPANLLQIFATYSCFISHFCCTLWLIFCLVFMLYLTVHQPSCFKSSVVSTWEIFQSRTFLLDVTLWTWSQMNGHK